MVSIKLLTDSTRKEDIFLNRSDETIGSSKTEQISVRQLVEQKALMTAKRGGGERKGRTIKAEMLDFRQCTY